MIGFLTGSDRPRKYWSDLKRKISDEGNEVSEKIGQLKLKSSDGKYRLTDVVDIEEMFKIIEIIPSTKSELIKNWLAKLESEKINDSYNLTLNYQNGDFSKIVDMIEKRRCSAYKKVNEEMILLYLEVGKYLYELKQNNNYENNITGKVADYIKENYPTIKEFKKRNITTNDYVL
jgi:plasmid maintenance system killer protein